MAPYRGFGVTIPFGPGPLVEQRELVAGLAELGYTDAWSAEADGHDGLTPLALASVWAPTLRLAPAIIPAFTRGPALLAQSVASMSQAAPGRFALGIGSSSNVIVERWNGMAFDEPYRRVRDTVRFLRAALSGEKISHDYETFSVNGFRLGIRPVGEVPILIAALREGMLNLAGREGDGAILNWLSAEDVARVAPVVQSHGDDKEIVARIFVIPSEDIETVRASARFAIAAYLNVPVYAAFHEWLGRGGMLAGMWQRWSDGDRAGALAAIPDELVDQLIVHGSPAQCRAHVQRYVDNGVTTPVLLVMPVPGVDPVEAVRQLAPAAAGS